MDKPTISETAAEAMQDRLVWKRLSNDPAYLHAADAEAQAQREEEISEQVFREIRERYDIS